MKQWMHEYTANIEKVNEFYLSQLQILINKIDELKTQIKKKNVFFSNLRI